MLGILALGIVGNILSFSVWTRSKLRIGRMAKYMSLLAMADLCTLISGIFIRLLPEYIDLDLRKLNKFSCYFQYFFLGFFACISAWTLIVMTVERFVVIAIPLTSSHCLARCKAPALITALIIMSAIVNTPLVLTNSWDNEAHCVSNADWDDTIKLVVFTLYSPVPIFFLLILNIAIISKMNRFTNRINKDPNSMKSVRRKRTLMPVAADDTGGITMIAVRKQRHYYDNISQTHNDCLQNGDQTRNNRQTSRVTGNKRRKHQTVTTVKLSDGTKVVKRHRRETRPVATISHSVSTDISNLDVASDPKCINSQDNKGFSVQSLPDLVIESSNSHISRRSSIDSIGVSESMISDLPSSVFEQETDIDQYDVALPTEAVPDIALSVMLSSHEDLQKTSNTEEIDLQEHKRNDQAEGTLREASKGRNDFDTKSECLVSKHSLNVPMRQRSLSHPPTTMVLLKQSSVFHKRRSSIALMIDNWKTRTSEHLAEKYNKLRSKKMTIMLLTVTFSYLILTLPYTISVYILVYMSLTSTHEHGSTTTPNTLQQNTYLAQHFLELLLCLNHSINIFLYCATGSKFRREFRSMFMLCAGGNSKRTDTLSEDQSPSGSGNGMDSDRSMSA